MTTSAGSNATVQPGVESRVLKEGYGPGAWHGADLKAAVSDLSAAVAFWRPAPGRHNIAEIALHHAYCARNVRAQLSGRTAEPFVMPGDDWFDVSDEKALSWRKIQDVLDAEQQQLAGLVDEIEAGKIVSPLADTERFNLVLGITCHAVYHAGQVQLIKRLREE